MKTPSHLGPNGRSFWTAVQSEYEIEDAQGLALLRVAAEALDRLEQARQILAKDGLTQLDRFGVPKQHPMLTTEKDARAGFLAATRALGLEPHEDEKPQQGRPPGLLPREFRRA